MYAGDMKQGWILLGLSIAAVILSPIFVGIVIGLIVLIYAIVDSYTLATGGQSMMNSKEQVSEHGEQKIRLVDFPPVIIKDAESLLAFYTALNIPAPIVASHVAINDKRRDEILDTMIETIGQEDANIIWLHMGPKASQFVPYDKVWIQE